MKLMITAREAPPAAPKKRQLGFGLVELIVTVAILGVLMLIAIPVFGAIQKTAADNVSKSSLAELSTAIELARSKENSTLYGITKNTCTMCGFAEGVDPLTVPKGTGGWITYNNTLASIGKAAGMDIGLLLDAHGRPLYIDENEGEGGNCSRDVLATYKNPYVNRNASTGVDHRIALYTYKC